MDNDGEGTTPGPGYLEEVQEYFAGESGRQSTQRMTRQTTHGTHIEFLKHD